MVAKNLGYEHVDVPSARLYTGAHIPFIGLGTWKAQDEEVAEAVENALHVGYRHIDTAMMYSNHTAVGRAIQKVLKEARINREDLWITSKLHNTHHAADKVLEAAKGSLADLQLEYLDLFLMHWPISGNKGPTVEPSIKETWQAMEKLVDQGLVKHIGISNFSVKKIKDLLTYAHIKPAVHQIEVHPYFRNDYNINFCRSQDIHVTAYSPLGSPDSATMMKRPDDTPSLLQDKTVKSIADKLGKNPAAVLVRWAIQHGTSVIPKSTSPDHLRSNLDVVDWELPPGDFDALCRLPYQMRMVEGNMWVQKEGPYKSLDELWDGETTGSHDSKKAEE